MLERFTVETFVDRISEVFVVAGGDGTEGELQLELIECERLGDGQRQRAPFSLIFRGPAEPILPQRTYPLRHDQLGAFELFIVPVGRDDAGTRYQAVFN